MSEQKQFLCFSFEFVFRCGRALSCILGSMVTIVFSFNHQKLETSWIGVDVPLRTRSLSGKQIRNDFFI